MGADVCRTSSRASRRPPDVISAVAILDPWWRRRKWRQPRLGARFSTPIEAEAQDGGPSASGRHLGWPHSRNRKLGMRSSKMAAGSGRAAILRLRLNGGRKTRPILLRRLKNNNCHISWLTMAYYHHMAGQSLGPCRHFSHVSIKHNLFLLCRIVCATSLSAPLFTRVTGVVSLPSDGSPQYLVYECLCYYFADWVPVYVVSVNNANNSVLTTAFHAGRSRWWGHFFSVTARWMEPK